ncbi:8893_t:CDS:10 [Funneliformis caledonium]|uniref:8893_t:CDS:1 n=2 Tax=Funneliformis TaxID=1117308 RepID=A0A9N9G5S0_9GLOM|nr:8893_t:CDS:10 [Funneliformis caledonium]
MPRERPIVRRSLRIQRRDDKRKCEELERKALEEIKAQTHVPKRLTKQPIRRARSSSTLSHSSSKKKKVYHDLAQMSPTSRLLSIPLDMLLYLLEFLGPSLAAMEQVSKSFYHMIRGQHSPYRFLYDKLLATYCPIDECAMDIGEQVERAIHAPVLPKIRQSVVKQESREFKVSDWKVQFVESYKYYVTEVCTVCGESGDPIPIWEVRLCRFCVVRQLINKSALYAFTLSPKEIEVLKPWKTYVYDLGMSCTFYLRNHLDHLRRQKYSDPQCDLDLDVKQRQSEKFAKENVKRKRKQREQDESYSERMRSVLQCFSDWKLKAELSIMEEWWFPKELKLEIHEYISNKTNNSLARKRLRLSIEQESNNGDDSSTPSTPSNSQSKSKSLRKNLEDIMFELQTVVVPRVNRLVELNTLLSADIAIEKLRMDLDLKTRRIYDDFVLGGGMISSPSSTPSECQLTVDRTHKEILSYFEREEIFKKSLTQAWLNINHNEFMLSELDHQRFLRDAKEWWARRGKKPPPEKCGELYLARVHKRQIWLKNDMSLTRTQEHWRRQLLERKLKEKIDWYFTDLPRHIKSLSEIYESNLEQRMKNSETFWMKGLSSHHNMREPSEKLKQMYCDYEDFIKNCNGFCSTDDGYCGCLEYAAKDIIRANTILRRKEWMDAELRCYKEIDFHDPDLLLCPEAKDEYHYAARNISVPKRAAVLYIARAESFMQKLRNEVKTFAPELITSEAREWYRRCLGTISDFFDPPRRPCSWTALATNCFYYEVNCNPANRPSIEYTIEKIKECERIRLKRLGEADRAAREAKLSLTFWNKAMVKRPVDGVSFQTRVRWIATNGWFSLNQLAQAWVYDEDRAPLSHLEPYIKERVKQMEKDKRKEDISLRIKDDPEYQAIFREIDEDADFFLRSTYEITTIYKVSNLYKAHVEDVKSGIDPAKVVRQVIGLIRDVKTGVISKSSLFVADLATNTTTTTMAATSANVTTVGQVVTSGSGSASS